MTYKTRAQRQRAREWERNKYDIIGIWTLNVLGFATIIAMALLETGIL